jgi:hypothetical protein
LSRAASTIATRDSPQAVSIVATWTWKEDEMRGRVIRLVVFSLLLMVASVSVVAAANNNYKAQLKGRGEIPVRDTNAQGQAIFKLSEDGTELHYKLIVANIENVVQAHIHLGGPTVNGPVVAFLYGPVAPGGGRTQGVLAEGTITAGNLINNLAGQSLSALMAEIKAGNTYVNVHTNDGDSSTNLVPGDFPGGEVRGTIE